MKVSDYIADFLAAQGVSFVFELIGGMTVHIVDSIYSREKIQIVSMHHEQAAAFAADAAGRLTGIPGVAMATSGPGATNLLTGIGSCYFDSSPAVFITGQVNRSEQKGERAIRQLGFQETDIVSMVGPITKGAWRVESPEEIPTLLKQAFELAVSGRPGPVLIDIPMDVQRAQIFADDPQRIRFLQEKAAPHESIQKLLEDLSRAERPLILVGNGARAAGAVQLFRNFVEQVHVPVVNSLLAVDVVPYDHPLRVGMIGSYGNRWANLAIGSADFLLVLGSRLDIRQTGADTNSFKGSRIVYHVDCEAGEINNRVQDCYPILSDLCTFLDNALQEASGRVFPLYTQWHQEIDESRRRWPDTAELSGISGINPNSIMHQLAAVSGSAAAFVVDVGQHQMWAAQSLEMGPEQRFLTSGGMGAMGFGLPAAIGAAFAMSNHPIVMIAGDGSFQLNIQELQTIVRNQLPVKIVVMNNGCHGMVRQFQQSYFEERYAATYWGYSAPDFTRIAEAYGIPAFTIEKNEDIGAGLDKLWQDPQSAFLLQVMIDPLANAYPKLAFGRPITEMEPLATPIDMEAT